jgi:SNF2 family DNA or RNA helicase
MGLGKTVQMIAVIVASRAAAAAAPGRRPTLVVCPVSVMSVWTEQLAAHVAPGALSVHVYHGPGRTRDPAELSRHDVVLTSYSTSALRLTRIGFGVTLART